MRILVTGTSGHLGEALARTLRERGDDLIALDVKPGPLTSEVGSIADRHFVSERMQGVDAVLHAATLHKPHVATHSRQQFVDTNVSGTLNLLEEALRAGVASFVFTSTTSVFGHALHPGEGEPAIWVDEGLTPRPRNIYGVTKLAAEELCRLIHELHDLPLLILRTSRFFPEDDDDRTRRRAYAALNSKVNELLYRRVDIADAVSAHLQAIDRATQIGFGRYIISATTPFTPGQTTELRRDAPAVVRRHVDFEAEYERRRWRMFPSIDRVYDNRAAREALGWVPEYDFATAIERLRAGEEPFSLLSAAVGSKGYHQTVFEDEDGPYPIA